MDHVAAGEKRREPTEVAAARPSGTPMLTNGRSADEEEIKQAIPQTTPTGRKRRRRAK
jgi:hypothetical protein